jgi:hypothetical protein
VSDLISEVKVAILGAKSGLLAQQMGVVPFDLDLADVAIFIVSANHGIISADLEEWRRARELYIPSIVAISDLTASEIDFEDMSAIATKMLDPVVTPYLVLHSDSGSPVALIDLETHKVLDYSKSLLVIRDADAEHIDLVNEFRLEYLEAVQDAGEDSFAAGLLFPALPWIEDRQIGVEQIKSYLNQIPVIR